MQTLLILFSLLLHGVAFLIIRYQSVKMSQVQKKAELLRNQSNEMEELLSTYLYEIKEENNRFLAMMKQDQPLPAIKSVKPTNSVLYAYKKGASEWNGKINSSSSHPIKEKVEKASENSLFVQVLDLYNSGVSAESIAKKLNIGKTEVALMLKFHHKDNIMP